MAQKTERSARNHYLQHHLQQSRDIIQSLKTKQDEKRRSAEKLTDVMTSFFGSMGFLAINVAWFALWIAVNLELIPGVAAFDPFPFGLLTMIVSLEAIALAIFVLISQNRSAKIADLREEIDLQVDMLSERELTKLLHIVCAIAEKQGIDLGQDEELRTMLEPTSMSKIEHALEVQILGLPRESPPEEHSPSS
ncbi:MAG: DUF1003 domain-containing protein [Chloroflexi bacterium]|nr:DUF1003 domain-containing protein [Chloroflexota bacterium]